LKRKKQFLFERFHSLNRGKWETKKPNLSAVLIEFLSSKQTKFTKVDAFSRKELGGRENFQNHVFFFFCLQKEEKNSGNHTSQTNQFL
jgi:hypothetical protein